ncbi:hypothetical protein G6F66_014441 [Rhizopus arrhizus]|nr:hypothetical protein G6F66_014441 [Rhizopus arrhizus]
MLAEAQAAREVVDRLSAEPRGVVRASVPVSLAQMQLPKLLPRVLEQLRRRAARAFAPGRRRQPGDAQLRPGAGTAGGQPEVPGPCRSPEGPGRADPARHPQHQRRRSAPALGAAWPGRRSAPG